MASTDATPFPMKNVAYRVTFPILDADGDLVTGATSPDSEVSKDGGAFADCTNEATEIATSSGMYYLDLTSTEMNADTVAIIVKSGNGKTTPIVLYPQEAGDINVDVTYINGSALSTSSAQLGVNLVNIAGAAVSTTTAQLGVNIVQISTDATAADNAELFFDGTGYAGGTTKLGVDVVSISSDTTAADNLELMFDGTGYAGGTTKLAVNAVALSGSTAAADNAEAGYTGVVTGTAITGTLSTTAFTTDLTEATNDHYTGRIVTFTSGVLAGQQREITGYNGTTKAITVAAMTDAPSNADAFFIA